MASNPKIMQSPYNREEIGLLSIRVSLLDEIEPSGQAALTPKLSRGKNKFLNGTPNFWVQCFVSHMHLRAFLILPEFRLLVGTNLVFNCSAKRVTGQTLNAHPQSPP